MSSPDELISKLDLMVMRNEPIDRKLITPIKMERNFSDLDIQMMFEKALDGMCWHADHGMPTAVLEYAHLVAHLKNEKERREAKSITHA